MFDQMIDQIKNDKTLRAKYQEICNEKVIPSKTILLHEGEISRHVYIIKKGCLRQWFNKDGKDITVQFFFEGQAVASIESFLDQKPGLFTLESIEPSVVISVSKSNFDELLHSSPSFQEKFQNYIYQRFRNYASLFLSRIKDTPRERYQELLQHHPEIIQRIPQHYIASYLGITSISLSRIKNRK